MALKVGSHFCVVILTALFILVTPLVFLLMVPVVLWRFLVARFFAPVFRTDLHKIIPRRSAVLAVDDPYVNPKWNLVVWIVVEGNLDMAKFSSNFLNNIVMKKLANGQFSDPEYQQCYAKYLGFMFWAWEKNFHIDEHIRTLDAPEGTTYSEEDLKQLLKNLTWAPFKPGRSPWEFLLVPNYKSASDGNTTFPKSVLVFRVHHGVCDGLVILRLLMQELNGVSTGVNANPHYMKKSQWESARDILSFPLKAPYEFARMLVESRDNHPWHQVGGLVSPGAETCSMAMTSRIPIKMLKEIKTAHKVSFNALVISAISGGLRKLMVDQGLKVPKNLGTAVPLPMPAHPTKLRNHFVFALLKLPVGIADPVQRLQKVQNGLVALKKSVLPLFNWAMIPFVGSMFHWLTRAANNNVYSTAIISNFPGPVGGHKLENNEGYFIADGGKHWITDMNFSGGAGAGTVALGFCLLSYWDGMRIVAEVSSKICPTDADVVKLNQYILDEIHQLKLYERQETV